MVQCSALLVSAIRLKHSVVELVLSLVVAKAEGVDSGLRPRSRGKVTPSTPKAARGVKSVSAFMTGTNRIRGGCVFKGDKVPNAMAAPGFNTPPRVSAKCCGLFILPSRTFVANNFHIRGVSTLGSARRGMIGGLASLKRERLSYVEDCPAVMTVPGVRCNAASPKDVIRCKFLGDVRIYRASIIFKFAGLRSVPRTVFMSGTINFKVKGTYTCGRFSRPR